MGCQRITNIMQSAQDPSAWVALITEMCSVEKEMQALRRECELKIKQRDDCVHSEENLREVLAGYTGLIMRLIEALNTTFGLLGNGAGSRGAVLSVSDLKLRFLQLAGEQLARER